jgi:hypothetical protein
MFAAVYRFNGDLESVEKTDHKRREDVVWYEGLYNISGTDTGHTIEILEFTDDSIVAYLINSNAELHCSLDNLIRQLSDMSDCYKALEDKCKKQKDLILKILE